jgi:hypothetical protein
MALNQKGTDHLGQLGINGREVGFFFLFFPPLLKSWVTQNFITIKTSWNTND